MEDKIFKQDAKTMVDMLFESKCFREDITRDSMTGIEDLIIFLLQSRHDSHIRITELMKKIESKKHPTT